MRKYIDILNEALAEDSLIDKTATPAEYEKKDDMHYEARRKTGFFGEQAAGCLIMAKSTGRIMIVLRSAQVDQPHVWGNVGGAFDASEERPVEAAKREAHEETGYTGSIQMIPLYVFQKGTFKYSNFLAIVEDEFKPHLGWEADRAVWVEFGHWPKPLHFGLVALFGDTASYNAIKHYSDMFRNGNRTVDTVNEAATPPFHFNVAAMGIVPVAALKATTAEDQIDALWAVADDPSTERSTSERIIRLISKLNAKMNKIEEDINLPAGVDVAKAISDAQDAVKALAGNDDPNADPDTVPATGQTTTGQNQPNNQTNGQQSNGQTTPATNGQTQSNNQQAPAQQAPNAPKSLAPIKPQ